MLESCKISLKLLAVMTLLTGGVYPLFVTWMARAVFPAQASGSLVRRGDQVIGSALLGQSFRSPKYFMPRPSAGDYATVPSAASNLSPGSHALLKKIKERQGAWGRDDVPADLLTASGSGLDPHITPEAAAFQLERIARERHLAGPEQLAVLRNLVAANIAEPQWGFLGTKRVNVLLLNLKLDDQLP